MTRTVKEGGSGRLHPLVDLRMDRSWFEELQARVDRNGPWDDWTLYQLAMEAEQSRRIESFDELQCLRFLNGLEPMKHQTETAVKVLHDMGGRAILADEVGLGKTIEAGLVLKEYMVRGLVRRALILVPASLVLQWVRELNTKFGITAVAQKRAHTWNYDVVVASIDTAKREPHRDLLLGTDYDMLIIDEAHKLKNKKTTNYQFITQLRKNIACCSPRRRCRTISTSCTTSSRCSSRASSAGRASSPPTSSSASGCRKTRISCRRRSPRS